MRFAWMLVVLVRGVLLAKSAQADQEPQYEIHDFQSLTGWEDDDHDAALKVFLDTCDSLDDPDWASVCRFAKDAGDAKQFFELFFRPVLITDGTEMKFTGYFEPELQGSPVKTPRFRHPIYKMPDEARSARPWLTRREILTGPVMQGRGLEICWVDDPVELFFLQVQGSGRIRFPDGSMIRVGYAGANGHDYKSIGQELVRRGVYEPHQVSAQVLKNWVKRNPVAGRDLLFHNTSYVFFREVSEVPSDKGPIGAMNRSITTMRSVAVDPKFTPLGAPVWIEKEGQNNLTRLMIAQDTGSAIKGAQRADIFFGTGDAAGVAAGRIRDAGRMFVLMPIQRAYAFLPEHMQ